MIRGEAGGMKISTWYALWLVIDDLRNDRYIGLVDGSCFLLDVELGIYDFFFKEAVYHCLGWYIMFKPPFCDFQIVFTEMRSLFTDMRCKRPLCLRKENSLWRFSTPIITWCSHIWNAFATRWKKSILPPTNRKRIPLVVGLNPHIILSKNWFVYQVTLLSSSSPVFTLTSCCRGHRRHFH